MFEICWLFCRLCYCSCDTNWSNDCVDSIPISGTLSINVQLYFHRDIWDTSCVFFFSLFSYSASVRLILSVCRNERTSGINVDNFDIDLIAYNSPHIYRNSIEREEYSSKWIIVSLFEQNILMEKAPSGSKQSRFYSRLKNTLFHRKWKMGKSVANYETV